MKTHLKTLIVLLTVLIFGFQNCSEDATSSSSDAETTSVDLSFTSYPSSQVLSYGEDLYLYAQAESEADYDLTYQWNKDGVYISGQTNQTLFISDVTEDDEGYYSVLVTTDEDTLESSWVYIQVGSSDGSSDSNGYITITSQPSSQEFDASEVGLLQVRATDSSGATIYYQWYKNGVAISGATSDELYFLDVTGSDEGYYFVRVYTDSSSLRSSTVQVTVDGVTCTGQTYNNSCYKAYSFKYNYSGAQAYCEDQGGYLVKITSYSENTFVRSMISGHIWIGANDISSEGSFKWPDGGSLVFSNWDSGEPNNNKNKEDCGEMYNDGTWNDATCTDTQYFVCEFD